MVLKKQIVTAALPYANGPLHIGHLAGCYLPSDIYARFQKAKGNDVAFVCGSDEHGVPISLRAKAENKTPQEVVDFYHNLMQETFVRMGIEFDHYSRTSSKVHHETAQEFFKKLYDQETFLTQTSEQLYDAEANQFLADRYITGTCPNCSYEKAYGDQCENCGKALSPDELINPTSALTGNKPELKSTTNWYLPLDSMQADLSKYIESKKGIWKNAVYGQCNSWLKDGLKPRAMTRDLNWGVSLPVPDTEGKVMYVWFDAPLGYISATKEFMPDQWEDYWKDPNTELIHFIGKDNIVFHCLIFPAMLMAEGSYVLPNIVAANEFLNLEGEKISTSRNYAVWVHEYLNDFKDRADEMRYVLCSIAPENKDADFSWEGFQARVNNELVAIFGNFINRVSVLTQKYYEGVVPEANNSAVEEDLWKEAFWFVEAIETQIVNYQFRDALASWINLSRLGNKYLADQEPWKTIKTDQVRTNTIMHNAINLAALIGVYSKPFLPATYSKLAQPLKIENAPLEYSALSVPSGTQVENIPLLFQQITDEEVTQQQEKLKPKDLFKLKPMIQYDDFAKMQLVSATIKEAKKVENADKLLQITLAVSDDEDKTVLSGIAMHYKPEEIVGKQVTYLANLAPRKMRGIMSEGMILMAESEGKLVFVSPESTIENGSEIA